MQNELSLPVVYMKHSFIILNGQRLNESTLLIPLHIKDIFDVKVRKFGSVCKLFMFMVNSKHPLLNYRPVSETGNTTYAPVGQKLQKVNFRPRIEDWEKMRILALSRRISICFLFVLLLMNWEGYETGNSGVPATPNKISLLISRTTGPALTRIHLCRHRI